MKMVKLFAASKHVGLVAVDFETKSSGRQDQSTPTLFT